jgi:hypothetical protein
MAESVRVGRLLGRTRILCGVFVAGLVVLAISLFVVWGAASVAGAPGPGLTMLVGHAAGAVAAVVLQRVARRRTGRSAYLAALGPPAILFLLAALFWWS